jgi:hypothetical protein
MEKVLGYAPIKSWLDYREYEPNWIQVKIQKEEFNLDKLMKLANADKVITEDKLRECLLDTKDDILINTLRTNSIKDFKYGEYVNELTKIMDKNIEANNHPDFMVTNLIKISDTLTFIRFPGSTVGCIINDDKGYITEIKLDTNSVVTYKQDTANIISKFIGYRLVYSNTDVYDDEPNPTSNKIKWKGGYNGKNKRKVVRSR